jgi:hypothetical protein
MKAILTPRHSFETLTKLGIPIGKLTLAETTARYPQISTEGVYGAYLEPEAAYFSPDERCKRW